MREFMKIEIKSYANNSSLVSAVLFFILGAIMFTNPGAMVVVISRILGGILILFGLYSCIKNYILVRQNSGISNSYGGWHYLYGNRFNIFLCS